MKCAIDGCDNDGVESKSVFVCVDLNGHQQLLDNNAREMLLCRKHFDSIEQGKVDYAEFAKLDIRERWTKDAETNAR